MLRSLLRASAAVAFALLLAPATPSAAPPPGLSYDEIVRVVVNATPPPPGNFQTDLAAANAPVAAATQPPRKRGGLGSITNIANAVLNNGGSGAIANAVVSEAVSNAIENSLQQSIGAQYAALAAAANAFLQPHVTHYAYWNGWERVDDVSAQTATIRKCDMGQVVTLDLAKKTYTVYTPGSEPVTTPRPAPVRRGRQAPPDPAQPGTAVATFTEATTGLGPMRIENVPTTGFDATTSFAITQSTGSCRDGSAAIRTVEYISGLARPAVNVCPIRRAPIPETASDAVATPTGGCRPTFAFHRSGPTPPSGRLPLYSLVTFSAAAAATPAPAASPGAGGVGFLTERGNLKALGPADAALFNIPQGFTKTP